MARKYCYVPELEDANNIIQQEDVRLVEAHTVVLFIDIGISQHASIIHHAQRIRLFFLPTKEDHSSTRAKPTTKEKEKRKEHEGRIRARRPPVAEVRVKQPSGSVPVLLLSLLPNHCIFSQFTQPSLWYSINCPSA